MKLIALVVSASLLIFSLVYIVLASIFNKKMKIEERVAGLAYENKEEKQKNRRRKKKDKTKTKKTAKTRKELEQIEDELFNVGIKMSVQTFVTAWIGLTIGIPVVLVIVGLGGLIAGVAALVIAVMPPLYISFKKKGRAKKLEGQLVDAISVMCNALKAGHSFQTAMNNIASDMEAPIAEEFARVSRETQRGMTMDESMNRMVERCGSQDMEMLCTAILIQRKVGGNLADVLEKISDTIQSRIALRAEIKTRTASGKLSGYIVGALPVLLLVIMASINPDYAGILLDTDAGHYMLAFSVVWEVIGFIAINKIVTIKY